MLEVTGNKKIFLYDKQIDFRKGVSSLVYLIKTNYPNTDLSNCLFIFFASNKRQVKIIEIEDNSIKRYDVLMFSYKHHIFYVCNNLDTFRMLNLFVEIKSHLINYEI